MLVNNNQRLDVWLSIKDKFSYKEFATTCIYREVHPLTIGEFAQKVGMLMVAIYEYPNKTPADAYMELVKRMNSDYSAKGDNPNNLHQTQPTSGGGCSSCGKKKNSDGGMIV